MSKKLKKFRRIAESLEWTVTIDRNYIYLQKFSPAGQDFNVDIEASNIQEAVIELKNRCDNFDCSEEASLWLDDTGHGTNGAPYAMKDVYEDMEACLEMMEELYDKLKKVA